MQAMLRCVPLVAVALTLGCGAIDDFEVVLEEEATIDGTFQSGAPQGVDFGGFADLDLSTQREFLDEGIDPSDVDAIFVKGVNIVATTPENLRLDPLISSVELFVQATGLPKVSVAKIDVQDGVELRQLDLTVDSEMNFKPYAVAGNMTIAAEIGVKQAPAFTTTLKTTITLIVDINLLGV